MKSILVNTGYGYLIDPDGHNHCRVVLSPGEHIISDRFTFVEVANYQEMLAVELYQDPVRIAKQQTEQKIQAKTRELAITSLKAAGELPADFEDTI